MRVSSPSTLFLARCLERLHMAVSSIRPYCLVVGSCFLPKLDFPGVADPNILKNRVGAPSAVSQANAGIRAVSVTPLRGCLLSGHVLEAELAASRDIACRGRLCTVA